MFQCKFGENAQHNIILNKVFQFSECTDYSQYDTWLPCQYSLYTQQFQHGISLKYSFYNDKLSTTEKEKEDICLPAVILPI